MSGQWSATVELLVNGRPVGVVVARVEAKGSEQANKRITTRMLSALRTSYPKARKVGIGILSGTVQA